MNILNYLPTYRMFNNMFVGLFSRTERQKIISEVSYRGIVIAAIALLLFNAVNNAHANDVNNVTKIINDTADQTSQHHELSHHEKIEPQPQVNPEVDTNPQVQKYVQANARNYFQEQATEEQLQTHAQQTQLQTQAQQTQQVQNNYPMNKRNSQYGHHMCQVVDSKLKIGTTLVQVEPSRNKKILGTLAGAAFGNIIGNNVANDKSTRNFTKWVGTGIGAYVGNQYTSSYSTQVKEVNTYTLVYTLDIYNADVKGSEYIYRQNVSIAYHDNKPRLKDGEYCTVSQTRNGIIVNRY